MTLEQRILATRFGAGLTIGGIYGQLLRAGGRCQLGDLVVTLVRLVEQGRLERIEVECNGCKWIEFRKKGGAA